MCVRACVFESVARARARVYVACVCALARPLLPLLLSLLFFSSFNFCFSVPVLCVSRSMTMALWLRRMWNDALCLKATDARPKSSLRRRSRRCTVTIWWKWWVCGATSTTTTKNFTFLSKTLFELELMACSCLFYVRNTKRSPQIITACTSMTNQSVIGFFSSLAAAAVAAQSHINLLESSNGCFSIASIVRMNPVE